MGVCRPKVHRIALESAFEPSMMNNRGRVGSTPRSTKLSISAWTTEAFSVAPSISPRGCLIPSPSMPTAATRTRCSVMWMPSICTTKRSSPERSASIKLFMRSLDNATKCRDAADFDVPAPAGAGISPSGSRIARRNFRVETLMSIRFIAHRPSQSSATACSQLGSTISWPPSSRTRGRSTSILPPWKPIFPCVWPQRYPRRPSPRAWRAPQSSSASFSNIAESASMPAVKQNRSKLADTSSQALPTAPAFVGGKAVSVVLTLFMALLSFVESAPRAYWLKASNAAPSFSTFPGTIPRPHAIAHDDEYGRSIGKYAFRHHVKPGITGWAQVNGFRGGTPKLDWMKKRIDLDLWYIDNWSFWLDLWIIARTCFEVARGRNAY